MLRAESRPQIVQASLHTGQRMDAIDQYRGFAILLMVLANFLAGVNVIPAWLKHAPDIGLTVIDLIAPFFIFAIGLTYGLSYKRRLAAQGRRNADRHFIQRSLLLVGIGTILSAGEAWFGLSTSLIYFGVLQTIGMAGLVALPFIALPWWAELVVGLALLAGYQWLISNSVLWVLVLNSANGGPLGAFSWAGMLILACVLAAWFYHQTRGRRAFFIACSIALALGLAAAALGIPVSKNRVSASYVLVSLGASGLLFGVFYLLSTRLHMHIPLLTAWGKNPLLLYILHLVLLGVFVLPGIPAWYQDAPLWLAIVQAVGLIGALSAIGLYLERKGWFLSL